MNDDLRKLSPGPVLITGATGFTGSHLIRRLAGAGVSVRAIARPSSDRRAFDDLKIEWFIGDVFDPALVNQAVDGAQHIFNIATLYRSPSATEEDHRRVHVDGTRLLAEAAARQPGFQRFVHVSTVGVHGHIEHPPADENAPFAPGDEYQRTKAEAERWLVDFTARHSLDYTIIRPCAIYGPGDKRLLKLFRMARRRWCPIIGNKPCLYHLIHVDDLVAIMIRAATHPAAAGQAFIAGDPAPVPLDELLGMMAEAQGRRTSIIRLPMAPFWAVAVACEAICKPLDINPPLYRRRLKFFTNDRSFNTNKLQSTLGYSCMHTPGTGLKATADWYQNKGWL